MGLIGMKAVDRDGLPGVLRTRCGVKWVDAGYVIVVVACVAGCSVRRAKPLELRRRCVDLDTELILKVCWLLAALGWLPKPLRRAHRRACENSDSEQAADADGR